MPFNIQNPRVEDHRKHRVTLLDAEPGFFTLKKPEAPVLRGVARPLWSAQSRLILLGICAGVFLFTTPVLLAQTNVRGLLIAVLSGVVFSGLVVLVYAVLTRALRQADADVIIESVIGQNRCPCCFFDLARTVTESDGCKVCPECGGAWNPKARRHDAGPAPVK